MSRRPHHDDLEAKEEIYASEQFDDGPIDNSGGLHRNNSLSRSVYIPPQHNPDDDGGGDENNYEDSDFGVRVPHVDVANEHGEHPDDVHLIEPPREVHHEEQGVNKHGNRAPFIACPWDATFDRTKPTAIAPNGFIVLPKKANAEQKTIFALPRSRELSAEVLALCSRENSFDKLVNLLLIRDTFEPFAVDINFADPSNGQTPLMAAASNGMLDIVQLLYECSFNWVIGYPLDVDKTDFTGTTALMKAAQNGHLILVKYLLEILGAHVEMVDYDGWSALMFAAAKGHWHIVEYLVLARDADVLECTVQGDTPLMLAANNGYLNVVRYLVEHTDAGDKFDEESMRLKEERRRAEAEANGEDPDELDMGGGAKKADENKSHSDADEADEEDGEDDEDEDPYAEENLQPDSPSQLEKQEKKKKKNKPSESDIIPDGPTPAQLALQAKALKDLANKTERRGLEQANLKGWTALLGAAHYGQLYVVHYLVSKGANPDITDKLGRSSRDIPMSLLAHNRHGVPVIQPQVLAAIEKGLKDRGKEKKNIKRNAVERCLIRFKRAERFMIDGDYARMHGQFEIAALLYSYAFGETRSIKLIKEEIELRAKAKQSQEQMAFSQTQLVGYREKSIRGILRAEAQRNFFLAERYIIDKSYQVALQCLSVCLQYEPTNEQYLDKEAFVKRQQNAKSSLSSDAPAPSPAQKEGSEKKSASSSNDTAQPVEEIKPPRSCSLFGFSWF